MTRALPLTVVLCCLAACGEPPAGKPAQPKSKSATAKPAKQAPADKTAKPASPEPAAVQEAKGSTGAPAIAAPPEPDPASKGTGGTGGAEESDPEGGSSGGAGSEGGGSESGGTIAAPVVAEARVVPVKKVEAAAAPAPWRTVATPSEPLTLQPLLGGVLAKSASGYHDVNHQGALVLRKEIEATPHTIMGYWPKNAWHIETRDKRVDVRDRSDSGDSQEIRLMRLRGKRRWVPQQYEAEQRFDDHGHDFAVGGNGGLLVELGGYVTRVAGQSPSPEMGTFRGEGLEAFFETKSGRLYTVRRDGDALYVQRDCTDEACVALHAMKLPSGTQWSFGSSIRRRRHSLTAVAEVQVDAAKQAHLLHYAAGGWRLEALAEAPRGLWATKDGGLWVAVGDALMHRDPEGQWRNVTLPEGASAVTAAMHGPANELWIAATVADKTVVFATHANAQADPPPEPAQ